MTPLVTDVVVTDEELRLDRIVGGWALAGAEVDRFALVNEYLSYLSDRNYSPQTVRVYGFSLLAFCRWLTSEEISLDAVSTDVLLRYLAACRQATVPGRPGPNVVRLDGRRADGYAPATVNHRLAAISGLFEFRAMRDPDAKNPVPRGRERLSAGERNGLLAHVARRPRQRSVLRLREPQGLPQALDPGDVVALVGACGRGGTGRWRD